MLVFLVSTLTPDTTLVLTGDWLDMKDTEKALIIANHQNYLDWIYLWLLARKFGRHGDLKIMLIQILQYVPILGMGMKYFEFIFMHQKLEKDRNTMLSIMEKQKTAWKDFPMWMLIFPEGTLNTPENRNTCRAYAKKKDITEDPKIVLLPKGTGTFMISDILVDQVDTIFDLTVGYSGIDKYQIPYEEYLVDKVFFQRYYPKEIHINVKKLNLRSLPGLDSKDAGISSIKPGVPSDKAFDSDSDKRRIKFSEWIKSNFMEKDSRMLKFYEKGGFEGERNHTVVSPGEEDFLVIGALIMSSWFILPFTWRVVYTFYSLVT